jgi:tetratricopeptide (TPR) repeat protein
MRWKYLPLLFLMFAAGRAPAQKIHDEQLHQKILAGINCTVRQDYTGALRLFSAAAAAYPTHPAPYIYLAGAIQAENTDDGREFHRETYDSLLDRGEANAEAMIALEPRSPEGYYYAGTVLAYRAFTSSESGNWAGSIYQGVNAAKQFEKALELNPRYFDAMNGLGTYYYWRSKLAWVPFVSDRRAEGISMVMSAARRGTYECGVAENSLMLILIEEKRYAEAEEVALGMLAEVPNQRSFLWGLMTLYEETGNTAQLKKIVPRLLESIVSAPLVNYYNEAACRVKLAQYAFDEGNYRRALDECERVLALKTVDSLSRTSLRKKYSMAEDLMEKAKSKLARK